MVATDSQKSPAGKSIDMPRSTGRLRLACDSCHQAKVRCSGKNPCSTCQVCQTLCTYSPSSQPGRPKGSKNKRSSTQQNNSKKAKSQVAGIDFQWPDAQSSSPIFSEDFTSATDLSFLGDSMASEDIYMNLEDDIGAILSQTFTEQAAQSSYCPLPFPTPASSRSDHEQQGLTSPQSSFTFDFSGSQSADTRTNLELKDCSCLQQHIKLVYRLGELQHLSAETPAIDRILDGVQTAEEPWKNLINCARCQSQQNPKEVFLLFAMSIRILLSSLRKLCGKSQNSVIRLGFSDLSACTDIEVSVGSFKLKGEAKVKVVDIVIRKIVQSITSALVYLQDHFRHFHDRHSSLTPINTVRISKVPESQTPLNHQSLIPENLGINDIETLLNALQRIMQTMGHDSEAGAEGSLGEKA